MSALAFRAGLDKKIFTIKGLGVWQDSGSHGNSNTDVTGASKGPERCMDLMVAFWYYFHKPRRHKACMLLQMTHYTPSAIICRLDCWISFADERMSALPCLINWPWRRITIRINNWHLYASLLSLIRRMGIAFLICSCGLNCCES